jgi:hypothetical protein
MRDIGLAAEHRPQRRPEVELDVKERAAQPVLQGHAVSGVGQLRQEFLHGVVELIRRSGHVCRTPCKVLGLK